MDERFICFQVDADAYKRVLSDKNKTDFFQALAAQYNRMDIQSGR